MEVEKSEKGSTAGVGGDGEPAEHGSWGPRKKRFQRDHRSQILGPVEGMSGLKNMGVIGDLEE